MTNLRVLLVEDDPNWQKILEGKTHSALEGIGRSEDTIKVVKTFAEAYDILHESHWHLLVTDIGLKDSSISRRQKLGIQLVELANQHNIPVIVVSGTPVVNTQDVRNFFKEHNVSDYFKKGTFDNKKFINAVQELLQKQLQFLANTNELPNKLNDDDKQYVIIKDNPIKILFLASDPSDASRLRLGQELRDIQERLQLAKQREKLVLEQRWSVRSTDISQAILDIEPQIVHFSGHGINTGELCFEDNLGKFQPVHPDALAALFALVNEQVNCVVLNACYSKTQAETIAKYIPFVIGMNQEIGDQTAIAFAVGFYTALGANRSIEEAYRFGCTQIQLQGISEHLTPILYQKSFTNHVEK
ncbi:MAG: CHAT domain-containing protein [Scytonema sp. PMC 1069.18]|nr:CHAT domain-containing protein [Scytonema sp. PMC 1069.18]MEC4882950.1 CHAT domain-containing protein [Scytonema sp. PMC 1070.18]